MKLIDNLWSSISTTTFTLADGGEVVLTGSPLLAAVVRLAASPRFAVAVAVATLAVLPLNYTGSTTLLLTVCALIGLVVIMGNHVAVCTTLVMQRRAAVLDEIDGGAFDGSSFHVGRPHVVVQRSVDLLVTYVLAACVSITTSVFMTADGLSETSLDSLFVIAFLAAFMTSFTLVLIHARTRNLLARVVKFVPVVGPLTCTTGDRQRVVTWRTAIAFIVIELTHINIIGQ